jgi:hypothetical protein
MNRNRGSRQTIVLLWIILLGSTFIFGQELLDMPKPTHSETGVPQVKLTLVKEIEPDFNEDLFFVTPVKMAVGNKDTNGDFLFYFYDVKLEKIFMFNEKFFYIGQFLEHGQGPSEIFQGNSMGIDLSVAPDGTLYVSDPLANKLIQFSAEGKYIKDIRLPNNTRIVRPFLPVIDEKGFLYIYSSRKGIVDKVEGFKNVVHTYLDNKLNKRYVIFKRKSDDLYKLYPEEEYNASFDNAKYDMTSDGRLLIYLIRSSTVYLFEGDRLVRSFDIHIDHVLPIFKKRAEAAVKEQKTLPPTMSIVLEMFNNFFVDKDEPYFYLLFKEENNERTLYTFDLKGKLVKIIKHLNAHIFAKKNGLFFGVSINKGEKNIVIYKLEDSK